MKKQWFTEYYRNRELAFERALDCNGMPWVIPGTAWIGKDEESGKYFVKCLVEF
jgi:hypothetical protein